LIIAKIDGLEQAQAGADADPYMWRLGFIKKFSKTL
jgi:hypothetical protein